MPINCPYQQINGEKGFHDRSFMSKFVAANHPQMKRNSKLLVHVLFWVYMLNQQLFYFYVDKTYDYFWYDTLVSYTLAAFNFYAVYFSLPYLIRGKNKVISILIGVAMVVAIAYIRFGLSVVFWKYYVHAPAKEFQYLNEWVYNNIRLSVIYTVYAVLIKFAIDWIESQKLKAEMVNQSQASELALLRSQVNPHFLFNTLNNIYSLVCQKSQDAPEAIMKLSSIMRYMLYDTNTDKVLLEKEIEYLHSFIQLQKLRTSQSDFAEFIITGETNGLTIAPMLLIPFVENAFKHGSRNVPNPAIQIALDSNPEKITFEVTNYIRKNTVASKDKTGGIGLPNIRRRLDLLYPGKYNLNISEENDLYRVKLIIRTQ
jgi:two-component system, LytTR family, sensor kinase